MGNLHQSCFILFGFRLYRFFLDVEDIVIFSINIDLFDHELAPVQRLQEIIASIIAKLQLLF